jgi:hypothetical protein
MNFTLHSNLVKMKTRYLLFFAVKIVSLIAIGCSQSDTYTKEQLKPPLIVLCIDKSSSTASKSMNLPRSIEINSILKKLALRGGELVLYKIEAPTSKCATRFKFVESMIIDEDALLSVRAATKIINDSIASINAKVCRQAESYYNDSILNAPPCNYTDLIGALHAVTIILGEPQYSDCLRNLVIISDGIHSIGAKSKDKTIRELPAALGKTASVCTINWQPTFSDSTMHVQYYESFIGFTQSFTLNQK